MSALIHRSSTSESLVARTISLKTGTSVHSRQQPTPSHWTGCAATAGPVRQAQIQAVSLHRQLHDDCVRGSSPVPCVANSRRPAARGWRHLIGVSQIAGLRRGPSRPTAGVLAVCEHTRRAVRRFPLTDDGRCSGASFCTLERLEAFRVGFCES